MPDLITDSNQEILDRLQRIEDHLAKLLEAWREYEPIAGAFRRGGLLAARTAAKNGRAGAVH